MAFQREIRWLLEEKYKAQKINPKQNKRVLKDISRIKAGEPFDYVIGFAEFLGCKINLSQKPFIPRPETEFWVQQGIEKLQKRISEIFSPYSSLRSSPRPNPKISGNSFSSLSRIQNTKYLATRDPAQRDKIQVLDMFAGSGCIGIAILKHISFARVDFAEKEKKFVKQIKINAKLNGIDPKRYRVIQSDVFSNIKDSYDYIFANPPYIAKSKKGRVQKSVLEHEPHGALFGGKDGLRYIRQFLKEAEKHVNPEGKIYMEFDSFQKKAIENILRENAYKNFEFFRDQYKKWRYAVI